MKFFAALFYSLSIGLSAYEAVKDDSRFFEQAVSEAFKVSYRLDYKPGACERNVQEFLNRILETTGSNAFESNKLQVLLFVPSDAKHEGFKETNKIHVKNSRFDEMNLKGANAHVTLKMGDKIFELDFIKPISLSFAQYKKDFLSYDINNPSDVLVYQLPVLEYMKSSLSKTDAETWMANQEPMKFSNFN